MNLPPLQHDERRQQLPQGECQFRFPELTLGASRGRRCACEIFSLNKVLPGSICQCGHQAWYHTSARESSVSKDQYDSLLGRLESIETALEGLSRRENQEQNELRQAIQGLYSSLSSTSAKMSTRMAGQENNLEGVADKVYELQESTRALQSQSLSLDNARDGLEMRMNALEIDNLRSKQRLKEVTAAQPSLSHRSSQKYDRKSQGWSSRVLFVPHRLIQDPLNETSLSHRRCRSRGLLKSLNFDGADEGSFITAVDTAFSFVIRDRPWTPFIITLSSLGGPQPSWCLSMIDGKDRAKDWNRAFLERYCVQKGRQKSTPTIVIGLRDEELSWEDVKALPALHEEDSNFWQQDPNNDSESHSNQSRLSQRSGSRSSANEIRSSGNASPRSIQSNWEKEDSFNAKRRRKSSDDRGSGLSH